MTLEHRLDRLAPGLSARERALLSVRATLDDQREDPTIRSTMPHEQIAAFNHFIGIGNGVLHILLPHALVLSRDVEALRLRYTLFTLLGVNAKGDEIARVHSLSERVRMDLIVCWARLLAQEAVGAEIESDFGDPAALPDAWRDLMGGSRRHLEALHLDVEALLGSIQLPGAEESLVTQLRQGIRNQES